MLMASNLSLSVVIPAYNEATNFKAGALNSVVKFLTKQKYAWEVLLVNDESTDQTKELLTAFCHQNPNFKLMTIAHGGKSAAVTAGVLSALGEIILFSDFDQSTPIQEVAKFIAAHQSGADVAIGVRAQTTDDTWIRKIRSKAFLTLVQIVALPGIQDSQCGFKSFTRPAAKKVFSSLKVSQARKVTGGYMGAFDVEVLFLARKFGYRIDQVPVEWKKILSEKLNVWKEPFQMASDTLKIRIYDILGKYHAI